MYLSSCLTALDRLRRAVHGTIHCCTEMRVRISDSDGTLWLFVPEHDPISRAGFGGRDEDISFGRACRSVRSRRSTSLSFRHGLALVVPSFGHWGFSHVKSNMDRCFRLPCSSLVLFPPTTVHHQVQLSKLSGPSVKTARAGCTSSSFGECPLGMLPFPSVHRHRHNTIPQPAISGERNMAG